MSLKNNHSCLYLPVTLKMAIAAECKSWKVLFGRSMNTKYSTMLDEILEQIEDIQKRLGRPIKDLDDIRTCMAALKELQENKIRIDMLLGPIEVRSHLEYIIYMLP